MDHGMSLRAEEMDGRLVFVMHRSERFLSMVEAPSGATVGAEATVYGGDEGPYAIIEMAGRSFQRRIEDYLIHKPGQSVDDALEDAGLDDDVLIPRY